VSPDLNSSSSWIAGNPEPLLSAAAMKQLRIIAWDAGAPQRLLELDDIELLTELGLWTSRGLAREALLLAGSEDGLNQHFPEYRWKYEYHWGAMRKPDSLEGNDPLPVALARLLERIRTGASVLVMPPSSQAFEHRPFPEPRLIAALLNAFCHADYALGVSVQIKQEATHIMFVNSGGMPADVSPENILRRREAGRNTRLVQALTRLGLANQVETGMQRMYRELLGNGFQPPEYDIYRITRFKSVSSVGALWRAFACLSRKRSRKAALCPWKSCCCFTPPCSSPKLTKKPSLTFARWTCDQLWLSWTRWIASVATYSACSPARRQPGRCAAKCMIAFTMSDC